MLQPRQLLPPVTAVSPAALGKALRAATLAAEQLTRLPAQITAIGARFFAAADDIIDALAGALNNGRHSPFASQKFIQQQFGVGGTAILLRCRYILDAACIDSSLL